MLTNLLTKTTKKHLKKNRHSYKCLILLMVPKAGLEPARVSPLPPQDSVSTKFHHFGTTLILYKNYCVDLDCVSSEEGLFSGLRGTAGCSIGISGLEIIELLGLLLEI